MTDIARDFMSPSEFKRWRHEMNFTQNDAARALCVSKSTVENYERGFRRDTRQPVEIPYTVAFVCRTLAAAKGESDHDFMRRISTTSTERGLPTEGEAERFRDLEAQAFSRQVFANLLDERHIVR